MRGPRGARWTFRGRVSERIVDRLPVLPNVERRWRGRHGIIKRILQVRDRVLGLLELCGPLFVFGGVEVGLRGSGKQGWLAASSNVLPSAVFGFPVRRRTAAEPEYGRDDGDDDRAGAYDTPGNGAAVAAALLLWGGSKSVGARGRGEQGRGRGGDVRYSIAGDLDGPSCYRPARAGEGGDACGSGRRSRSGQLDRGLGGRNRTCPGHGVEWGRGGGLGVGCRRRESEDEREQSDHLADLPAFLGMSVRKTGREMRFGRSGLLGCIVLMFGKAGSLNNLFSSNPEKW